MQSVQDKIVDLMRSKSLREEIRKSDVQLSYVVLLNVIIDHAPDFVTRIELMRMLQDTLSGKPREYVAGIIAAEQRMLDAFVDNQSGDVYELHIKTEPEACEEKYLCHSLEAAQHMIPAFYREYECEETHSARYWVKRRKVLRAGDAFSEDYVGIVQLGSGGVIQSANMQNMDSGRCRDDCDDNCGECDCPCIYSQDIPFPQLFVHCDAVRYWWRDGSVNYGILLVCDGLPVWECFVIPLDFCAVVDRNFEDLLGSHVHVPAWDVERISSDELPPEMRLDYAVCVEYLRGLNL